jgi:hypothetical protein
MLMKMPVGCVLHQHLYLIGQFLKLNEFVMGTKNMFMAMSVGGVLHNQLLVEAVIIIMVVILTCDA